MLYHFAAFGAVVMTLIHHKRILIAILVNAISIILRFAIGVSNAALQAPSIDGYRLRNISHGIINDLLCSCDFI